MGCRIAILLELKFLGLPKLWGPFFESPCYKGDSVLGYLLGPKP